VHDTLSQTRALLDSPVARRPEKLMDMLAPVIGMYKFAPLPPIAAHHMGNGFRVDTDRGALYRDALDRLERADAWGEVERCLREAFAHQRGATPAMKCAEDLHVVVLLGDPSDEFFVNVTGGYYGVGAFPGQLTLTVWPTDANEHKVGYGAVHEMNHNLRSPNVIWDPATVTVGDHVISEGC
jgi:uncharacterized protein YjaZ